MSDTDSFQLQPMELPPEYIINRPEKLPGDCETTTHEVWQVMVSTRDGDLEAVRRLVEGCPGLAHAEYNYTSPIHFAVREGHTELVRFLLGSDLNYEPDLADNVVAEAEAAGRTVWDYTLELMMADGGKGMLMHPFENYADNSLETVHEMLTDEATVMGVADGGAHVGIICDASQPTFMLSYWARDRKRGRLPLEFLVRKQTRDTAVCYGLTDRGVLAAGKKADITVFDPETINLLPPEVIYDLPTGKRIMQKAQGYRHTFVSGVETLQDDTPTRALPGQLVR